jgi:hypothetical protein
MRPRSPTKPARPSLTRSPTSAASPQVPRIGHSVHYKGDTSNVIDARSVFPRRERPVVAHPSLTHQAESTSCEYAAKSIHNSVLARAIPSTNTRSSTPNYFTPELHPSMGMRWRPDDCEVPGCGQRVAPCSSAARWGAKGMGLPVRAGRRLRGATARRWRAILLRHRPGDLAVMRAQGIGWPGWGPAGASEAG